MIESTSIKKGGLIKYPFLLLLTLLLFNCKKETELGLEVFPEDEQLGIAVDTFSVRSYTIPNDSVPTDEQLTMLAGAYVDPVFGRVKTTLFTQLVPEAENLNFSGKEVVLDSAVMAFRYDVSLNGVYGKNVESGESFNPITLRVHELTDTLGLSEKYYSTSTKPFDPIPVGEIIDYIPNPAGSLTVDTAQEPAQVRIPLDSLWAAELLLSSEIRSTTAFIQFMKGIAVVTDDASIMTDQGSLLYLNPYSSFTRLEFYYRTKDIGQDDSLFVRETFRLIIDGNTARFNQYELDHAGTPAEAALTDTVRGSDLMYLQGLGGPHIFVKCEGYLDYFMDNPGILNLAELIIPVNDSMPEYALPPAVFIQKIEAEGGQSVVLDQLEGVGHIDGYYDDEKHQYRIVLTRQMHTFIEAYKNGERLDYGFDIGPTNERTFANRTILNGFAPTQGEKVRFRFVYTPL